MPAKTTSGRFTLSNSVKFSFSKAFDCEIDQDELYEEREKTADQINRILQHNLKNNIRFNVIGNRQDLPGEVNAILDDALERTAGNTGMVLTLALSYGARQEIVRAATEISRKVQQGELAPDQITDALFSQHLDTADLPDPDLLIRTSGEMRISNFLLWQLAYTELYFTDINWPDLTINALHAALADFQARERRFGKTSAQLTSQRS